MGGERGKEGEGERELSNSAIYLFWVQGNEELGTMFSRIESWERAVWEIGRWKLWNEFLVSIDVYMTLHARRNSSALSLTWK